MTGNAIIVAQELELRFGDDRTLIKLTRMDGLGAEVFAPVQGASPGQCGASKIFLICTSTYGQGDIPDSAYDLFESLQKQRPPLDHVRYGVLGLGDRTYQDTFNFGGMKFDQLMAGLGALRIGERAQIDASSGILAEDSAIEWMDQWLQIARQSVPS
jgi:MioC protein